MIKKTLRGPHGAILILDQTQVFPDDPDIGTPVMVKFRNRYSSYSSCVGDEECDGVELPQDVLDWLKSESVQRAVEEVLSL